MSSIPTLSTWRLTPGQRLHHRCWDGECVLYNDLSGDTHLLDEFALALLQQLQAAPRPGAQLQQLFGDDADPDGDDVEPLATVLADLAALHLIDCGPC